MVKIALDAMGGDLAPNATVEGALLAARDFGIEVVLVGDRDAIEGELRLHDAAGLPIAVEQADDLVGMEDSPLESLMTKPNSSIHVGLDLLKAGKVNGFVSAGNSGAVMTAAMVILGNLPNVDRPAIASPVPTTEGHAMLIDAGANTEVRAQNLVQFAVMGSAYSRHVRNLRRPRVGILANGEEASKGNDLTRAAAVRLAELNAQVNYIGYVEGRDINRGKADVVVTDGFTGNIALKTMEGFGNLMVQNLAAVFNSSWRGRLAYLLARKQLGQMRARVDPHEYGGAPLLGVNGATIIAHGSSNARAIRNAIRAAADESLVKHLGDEITRILAGIQPSDAAKPAGRGLRALFMRMRSRLHRQSKEAEPADAHQSHESAKTWVAATDAAAGDERSHPEAPGTAAGDEISSTEPAVNQSVPSPNGIGAAFGLDRQSPSGGEDGSQGAQSGPRQAEPGPGGRAGPSKG